MIASPKEESLMQKERWLLPAVVLWTVVPAAQAQLWLGSGPRPGQPGRYDVQNPPLAPQPWMSPTLQGIYRDAQTATAPWQNRRSPAVPISPLDLQSRLGPLSPCRPQDPWGPQGSFGPHGINPPEPRVSDILNPKQDGTPNPDASAQIPPE